MLEKQILKALLKHKFFLVNKNKLIAPMFPEAIGTLFETIKLGHERYQHDLTLDEIKIIFNIHNPTATRAQRAAFVVLVDELTDVIPLSDDVAEDAIGNLWRKETARVIAAKAIDIASSARGSFAEIRNILDKVEENLIPVDNYTKVSTELEDLLKEGDDTNRFLFNIPDLCTDVGGIGRSEFAIIFARPEVGKTAFWVSLAASPGGFIHQGLSVHAVINEEPAYRTMLRAVSAVTGFKKSEILTDLPKAKEIFYPLRKYLHFIDSVDFTIEGLDSYVSEHKPDILILDQLDKIHIDGSFARTDERLKAIYVSARELAKRRKLAVIGISQASAEAEGKRILSMDQLENSRTGKAAEADLIIGIGKSPMAQDGIEDYTRTLNILKNKITGTHNLIHCMLRPTISRYGQ